MLYFVSVRRLSHQNFKQLLKNINVEIQSFFSVEELDQLARDSAFVQRETTSKLTGSIFFNLIIFNNEKLKEQSLEGACIELNHASGIKLKKQSLHDRFNEKALLFLKKAFEKLFQQQLSRDLQSTKYSNFNRILIKDSICFQLDPALAAVYPGSGGAGSKAAIRLQFEYDLCSGTINDLSINPFIKQDGVNSKATLNLTREGDLIIRDLAYMSLDVLKKLTIKGASFLCRPGTRTTIYETKDGEYQKLNFKKIRCYMKKNNISMLEKNVSIGHKEKLSVRLILHLLPDQEVERRKRQSITKRKKKNRGKHTNEYKERLFFNLFITDTTDETIPARHVWPLYRLRWQIELVFKIWKSICHIDKIKRVKKHRFECYLYGRLIFILLGWKIIWAIARILLYTEKKSISFFKAFKVLFNKKIKEIQDVFVTGKTSVQDFLLQFYKMASVYLLLDKKEKYPEQDTIDLNNAISRT